MTGNKRRGASFPLGLGGPSVLMVLAVLCLVVFGLLSLMSARADLRLSARAAESTAAYYARESEANLALFEICEAFANVRAGAVPFGEAVAAAGRIEGVTVALEGGDAVITLHRDAGTHLLDAQLRASPAGDLYEARALTITPHKFDYDRRPLDVL